MSYVPPSWDDSFLAEKEFYKISKEGIEKAILETPRKPNYFNEGRAFIPLKKLVDSYGVKRSLSVVAKGVMIISTPDYKRLENLFNA